jgi:hypothetical protein
MRPWKQVKIFTDNEKSAVIEYNTTQTGLVLHSCEGDSNTKDFALYLTKEEAICIGQELIKYANEI